MDESEERLALARAKAAAVTAASDTVFRHAQLEALSFEDETVRSGRRRRLAGRARAPARVAGGDGARRRARRDGRAQRRDRFELRRVLLGLLGGVWPAPASRSRPRASGRSSTSCRPSPTWRRLAAREGSTTCASWTSVEEFDYATGAEFLNAPLVRDFLLGGWLESLPDEDDARARARRGRAHHRRGAQRHGLLALDQSHPRRRPQGRVRQK